jgi:hypothetical protein
MQRSRYLLKKNNNEKKKEAKQRMIIQYNREEVKQTSNKTSTKKITLALGKTIGRRCAEV